MREIVLVAMFGAVGAVGRHVAGIGAAALLGPGFPFGTLVVNVVGSLLLGFLSEAADRTPWATPQVRMALGTGLLGAFTTFSTFSVESVRLASTSPGWASLNVVGNLLLGLVAAGGGIALCRWVT